MSKRKGQDVLRGIGKSFYRYSWWMVDSDYLDDLNPADQAWMVQFLLEWYRCETRNYPESKRILTREMELEAYKRNTAAYKDTMSYKHKLVTRLGFVGELDDLSEERAQNPVDVSPRDSKKKKQRVPVVGPLDDFMDEKMSIYP